MSVNINNLFTDKETCNWFKASTALLITKQGLEKFVETEIQKVHVAVGKSCGKCYTENLVPCHKMCRKSAKIHQSPALKCRPCPAKKCDQIKSNIESYHRYTNPSWNNTRAELWATSYWEVAKCFLPPEGYINVVSVQETDFNGVISVLLNCRQFQKSFSFNIAPRPPHPECILTKARQIGRNVRHTSSCQVTDTDLNDYIQTFISLFAYLASDPDAVFARNKLIDLQNNQPFVIPPQLIEHLKDAQRSLVELNTSSKKLKKEQEKISDKVENTLEEIDIHIKTYLQILNQKAKDAVEHVVEEGQKTTQLIETYTQTSLQNIEEKRKEAEKHVSQEREKTLEMIETNTHACLQTIDEKGTEAKQRVAREGKKAVEIIESQKQETLQILKDKYKEINEGNINFGDQDIEEFRQRLIQHYNMKLKYMPSSQLSPSYDSTPLEEMYVTPLLYRTDKKITRSTASMRYQSHGQHEQGEKPIIHFYKDIFGATCRNNLGIFLLGEAGSGKTTFVTKLVLDWCKVFQSIWKTDEVQPDLGDIETLRMFPFVFLVTLRDSNGEREIPKMIKQQITDIIYSDFKRDKAYILVQQIMEKLNCLVVEDGLDEWTDVQNKLGQPLMVSSHSHCYVLTTTQPWKMADVSIKDSDIGDLFILEGVQDQYNIFEKMPGKYNLGDISSYRE